MFDERKGKSLPSVKERREVQRRVAGDSLFFHFLFFFFIAAHFLCLERLSFLIGRGKGKASPPSSAHQPILPPAWLHPKPRPLPAAPQKVTGRNSRWARPSVPSPAWLRPQLRPQPRSSEGHWPKLPLGLPLPSFPGPAPPPQPSPAPSLPLLRRSLAKTPTGPAPPFLPRPGSAPSPAPSPAPQKVIS